MVVQAVVEYDVSTTVSVNGNAVTGIAQHTPEVLNAPLDVGCALTYESGGSYPSGIDADIAEILIFNTILSDDDAAKVQNYLRYKYATY